MHKPYFDYGYCSDPCSPLYALWEPVLDRFLLVLDDSDLTRDITMVAMGRYVLFTVTVSSAENYQPNIIDNKCCENWTFSNKADIFVSNLAGCCRFTSAKTLINAKSESDWPVDFEKEYLQMCRYWLSFIKELKEDPLTREWHLIDRFVKKIYPHEEMNNARLFFDEIEFYENSILEILLKNYNNDDLWQQCIAITESGPKYISRQWQHYHGEIKP